LARGDRLRHVDEFKTYFFYPSLTIAVIATGGKQYIVTKDTKVRVEKIDGKKGDTVTFDTVLLIADDAGKACKLGTPKIAGAVVTAKILRQGRAKKVIIGKYKNKTRYRRTQGHKQYFTEVEISNIQEKKG